MVGLFIAALQAELSASYKNGVLDTATLVGINSVAPAVKVFINCVVPALAAGKERFGTNEVPVPIGLKTEVGGVPLHL